MLIRRINNLRSYARTGEYQNLQTGMNHNVDPGARHPEPQPRTQTPKPVPSVPEPIKEPDIPPDERWPWLKPEDKS